MNPVCSDLSNNLLQKTLNPCIAFENLKSAALSMLNIEQDCNLTYTAFIDNNSW